EDEKPPEPEDEKPPEPEDEKPPEPEKDKPTDKPPEEQNDKPKMVPGAAPHTGSRGPLIPGRRLSKASPKPKPRPPKPKKKKLSFWQRLLITMGFAPRGTKKKRKLSSKINEGLRPAARKIDGVIRKGVKKVSQGVDKIGKSIKSRGKGSKLESSLSVGAKETGKDMGSLNRKNGDSKKIIGDMSIKKSIENPIESDSKEFSESGQELKDNFKKFIENNTINHGFGVAVPLETVEKGRLRESINKVDTFEKFSIKNLETGKLLEDLREKLQLSKNKFSNLININSTSYHEVIRDKKGMNLKKFTQIPDLTYIKNSLTSQELKEIKIKAERILTSKDTIITCGRAHLNFNIDNLERIKIGKRDHIVLPTSEYELKGAREEAKKKVINYFNEYGKAPSAKVIRQLGLKGFYTNEEKYGRTHNDFLKECKVPIIQERIRNKPIEQEINIKPKLDESVEPIKELKINFQRFLDKEILQRGYGVIVPLNILKMVNYMKLFQKLINSINSLYKTLN
ncbi:MAG: hypothetical protein HWN67_03525, partial [Candidatus Helarchaeota archaeon]|nr:hypothetical protein [Candidatus Helarchaeota archaeon]